MAIQQYINERALGRREYIDLITKLATSELGVIGATTWKHDHYRISLLSRKAYKETQLIEFTNKVASDVFDILMPKIEIILPKMEGSSSGTYATFQASGRDGEGENQEIKFVYVSTAEGGARGGGYQYESDTVKMLQAHGIDASVNTDTRKSDIFIRSPIYGEFDIECKLQNAKSGEPTITYDYKTLLFSPSMKSTSNENAQMVCDVLNKDVENIDKWMASIAKAWFNSTGERLKTYTNTISFEEYQLYIKTAGVSQSSKKIPLPVEDIISYYKKKGANYFQIQGKGLYHIESKHIPELDSRDFQEALESLNTSVSVGIMNSGNKAVLRATIHVPFAKLQPSNISLDTREGLNKFTKYSI